MAVRLLLAPLLLAACSHASDNQRATASDDRLLNDAAAMLDANSVELNAVTDNESVAP